MRDKDLSKITYFLRDDGGCGYYRMKLPLRTMAFSEPQMKIAELVPGDDLTKFEKALENTEVTVIPRLCEPKFMLLTDELRREYGVKIIVDHDDNMFKVSPLSPHYYDVGLENAQVQIETGETVPIWEDGKNIDLKANRKRVDNFKAALEQADAVTVTTDILADIYKEYNSNVKVLPNCIDTDLWQLLPLLPHKGIRMGWFGGHSHYQDWYLLKNVIPKVLKKYKELTLVAMGSLWESTLKGVNPDQVEFHNWVATPAYPYKAAILDLDFAIIPLEDNEFNRCKSPIKWVEMGALNVPSVSSYVSPYAEVATEENGIFIENNDEDLWFEGISMMVEDSLARIKYGQEANKYVRENYDIWKNYPMWKEAYQ